MEVYIMIKRIFGLSLILCLNGHVFAMDGSKEEKYKKESILPVSFPDISKPSPKPFEPSSFSSNETVSSFPRVIGNGNQDFGKNMTKPKKKFIEKDTSLLESLMEQMVSYSGKVEQTLALLQVSCSNLSGDFKKLSTSSSFQEESTSETELETKEKSEKASIRDSHQNFETDKRKNGEKIVNISPFINTEKISEEIAEISLMNCPERLTRIIDRIKQGDKVCGECILITGSTGVGKSIMGRAIATAADAGCKMCLGSRIGNQYQNSGDVNLQLIFEEAEEYIKKNNKPCVLIIDEIEALIRKFNDKGDSEGSITRTLLGLLDHYKNMQIIFVGTANRIDKIPSMLKDRFTMECKATEPTRKQRLNILEHYLKQMQKEHSDLEIVCNCDDQIKMVGVMDGWNARSIQLIISDAFNIAYEKFVLPREYYLSATDKIFSSLLSNKGNLYQGETKDQIIETAMVNIAKATDNFKKGGKDKIAKILFDAFVKIEDPIRARWDKNSEQYIPKLLPLTVTTLRATCESVVKTNDKDKKISITVANFEQAVTEKYGAPKSVWAKSLDKLKIAANMAWPYAKEAARIAITAAVQHALNSSMANRSENFQKSMADRSEEFHKKAINHQDDVSVAMATYSATLREKRHNCNNAKTLLDLCKRELEKGAQKGAYIEGSYYSYSDLVELYTLQEVKAKYELAEYENTFLPRFDSKTKK